MVQISQAPKSKLLPSLYYKCKPLAEIFADYYTLVLLQEDATMDEEIEDMEPRPSSIRRTFTMRNNAARQVAVNFMPSRQLPYSKSCFIFYTLYIVKEKFYVLNGEL